MENNASTNVTSEESKGKKSFPVNSTIILSFVFLALGLAALSAGNFILDHNPVFFGIDYVSYILFGNMLPPLGYLLIGIAVFLLITIIIRNIQSNISGNTQLPQEDLNALRERVEKEPDKIEPIWDLGRGNLQQYFNRNLRQISNIYRLSVVVMCVGFLLIIGCIIASFTAGPNGKVTITPALVGALAGVITEFIGATFLFIYRSTVQQASNYMKTLERINSVGMATKILDTISDEAQELRDETKAEIVKLLLSQNVEQKDEEKNK